MQDTQLNSALTMTTPTLNPTAASFVPAITTQPNGKSLRVRIEMLNEQTNELNTIFMNLQSQFDFAVAGNLSPEDAPIHPRLCNEIIGAFGSSIGRNNSNNRRRRVQSRLKGMFQSLDSVQQNARTAVADDEVSFAKNMIEFGEETLESLTTLIGGLAIGVQKVADLANGIEASLSSDGGERADTANSQSRNADDDEEEDDDDDDGVTFIVERVEALGETNRRWTSPW